jgi:protein TonB
MLYVMILLASLHSAPAMVKDTLPGADTTVYTKVDTIAQYLGGSVAWNNLVRRTMDQHYSEIAQSGLSGTCIVRFIVHTDGTVTDITALTMPGTTLAKVMIDMVRKAGPWMPAMYNGKNVNSYVQQKVNFRPQ